MAIKLIFTLDYEIYGNGEGSLREQVFEPAEKLIAVFEKAGVRFVAFIEVAEIEAIEKSHSDPAINSVRRQIENLYNGGFEVGLHIHPQWINGRYDGSHWLLDLTEYNLCTLRRERVVDIVGHSIAFLRTLVANSAYTPLSFRAGNWLFQPSETLATILAGHGIYLDSSVFKGGLQHLHGLDYRRALRNGYYWRFSRDVERPDPGGEMVEIPIFSRMVPPWSLISERRLLRQKQGGLLFSSRRARLLRLLDLIRLRQPVKLDFCRMTFNELTRILVEELKKDWMDPDTFRPLVAIGHTKDAMDLSSVERLLSWLQKNGIPVTTFREILSSIKPS